MSVFFFTPRLVHKLGSEVWTGLLKRGFPVPQKCGCQNKWYMCPCVSDGHIAQIAAQDIKKNIIRRFLI
eukprot:1368256-Amphidinium_carterae.1